jgi:hypothetical protein
LAAAAASCLAFLAAFLALARSFFPIRELYYQAKTGNIIFFEASGLVSGPLTKSLTVVK